MIAPNTQLTIDLNSVSYVSYYYLNQHGNAKRIKPRKPSVRGMLLSDEMCPAVNDIPRESVFDRATRLGIIDKWKPVCIYQFRNNHSMRFEHDLAIKRKKQYDEHIFNKRK